LGVTAIIGVSGKPGLITKEVVEAMKGDRPIIFPMSNPTQLSECTAEEAFRWTNGRVLFASGSPFQPLEVNGQTITPSQANNAYIFPGLALGIISAQVTRILDSFFLVAARSLANAVADETLENGALFPPLASIREVSKTIAIAVANHAFDLGLRAVERPNNVRKLVESQIYHHRDQSSKLVNRMKVNYDRRFSLRRNHKQKDSY
jgi:malate dehydrogenase (oxaloacetate-decarboxylating)(NADP+)